MSKKRNSHTYALFQGRRKIYIGYTSDLDRRVVEHKSDGKDFDRVEKTSALMTEAAAQRREEQHLEAYSKGHDGKVPRYNKTAR
ncbi:MAG: GIY-YIG nuclease family protein [Betaproteobacteria bacterium]|nr:GIY-YIG nuclease family protein [Betaproteobacteria bacterium]